MHSDPTVSQSHSTQQENPLGSVRRGGKKHFLSSLLLLFTEGGGGPVCGLLVLIFGGVCVWGTFLICFSHPFWCVGQRRAPIGNSHRNGSFCLHPRLLGLQTRPKRKALKPQPQSESSPPRLQEPGDFGRLCSERSLKCELCLGHGGQGGKCFKSIKG